MSAPWGPGLGLESSRAVEGRSKGQGTPLGRNPQPRGLDAPQGFPARNLAILVSSRNARSPAEIRNETSRELVRAERDQD